MVAGCHLVFDGEVKHIYTLEDNLLRRMDIEIEMKGLQSFI
jgi:hypothetical protein